MLFLCLGQSHGGGESHRGQMYCKITEIVVIISSSWEKSSVETRV